MSRPIAEGSAGPRVLIVDDDPEICLSLSKLLADAGFDPYEAETGEEAMAVAAAEKPELVLLDVKLPDTSGYALYRRLRDQFGEDFRVIFTSGSRTEALDRTAGLMIGADDYITKPYDPGELLARVTRLLERRRSPSEPTEKPAHRLTPRELEVLKLTAEGLTSAQIAGQLVISPKTVSSHIERLLAKLEAKNRAEAVAIAVRDGII